MRIPRFRIIVVSSSYHSYKLYDKINKLSRLQLKPKIDTVERRIWNLKWSYINFLPKKKKKKRHVINVDSNLGWVCQVFKFCFFALAPWRSALYLSCKTLGGGSWN